MGGSYRPVEEEALGPIPAFLDLEPIEDELPDRFEQSVAAVVVVDDQRGVDQPTQHQHGIASSVVTHPRQVLDGLQVDSAGEHRDGGQHRAFRIGQ